MKLPQEGFSLLNRKTIKLRPEGFSLIEILIVIAIIGIMSGIGLVTAAAVQKNTRDAQRESDLRVIQSALQQYYADNNKYPNNTFNTTLSSGGSLKSCTAYTGSCPTAGANEKTYLNTLPKDPSGTSGVVYYYLPLQNSTSSLTCDSSTGTCHYYKLCGKKENLATGSKCNAVSGGYNFEVTPL